MREIVLDTETTGTDPKTDRLVEIGCVELIDHIPTGRTFHRYINPQVAVHPDAFRVHGLSDAFLADKPTFAEIVEDLIGFLGDGTLVIHNAAFDVAFLNVAYAGLGTGGPPQIDLTGVVDTLLIARRKHAGAGNSLDALCARYGIDASRRTKHGALLDAQILAEVYIELLGGKQAGFDLGPAPVVEPIVVVGASASEATVASAQAFRPRITREEVAAHAAFTGSLKEPIWARYTSEEPA